MKIKQKPTWELKNIKQALSGSLSQILNSEKDNKRLEQIERELKNREGEN